MGSLKTSVLSPRLPCEQAMEAGAYLDEMHWNDITDLRLIATLFSAVSADENANRWATDILNSFGSLSQILQTPARELHKVIPESPKAILSLNLLRLCVYRVVNEQTSDQIRINSPRAMAEYVAAHRNPKMAGDRKVLFLDRDSRLIADTSVQPTQADIVTCRTIAQEALNRHAFGLVVIDYVYADELQFSPKMRSFCDKIESSMANISIKLYDYMIVGINRFYSRRGDIIIDIDSR